MIELKSTLQADGKNVQARLMLADVFLAAGRGREAETEITHAEQSGATKELVGVRRARAYLMQGQYDRALKELPAQIIGDPQHVADSFEIRGDAQLGLGQTAEAAASYDEALKIRPDALHALYGKARVFARRSDVKNSMEMVDAGLRHSPQDATGLMLKGDLLLASGDGDGAIASYTAAVNAHGDNIPARLALASAQIEAKKFDAAEQNILSVKEVAPTLLSANYLDALLQFSRGKNQEAFASVQKVLSTLPDDPPSLILAGAIQYALGSQLQAELNTRKFLKIYPNNVSAIKLLASILLKSNQPAKAIDVLQPLLSRPDLKDPQVFALAGNAFMNAKRLDKGVEYLSKAAAISPSDSAIQTELGLGRLAIGDVDRAINSFESVVKADSKSSNADSLLVLSYLSKQDYQKAIDTALELVKKNPDNPDLYNLLGGAYLSKKDFGAARVNFDKALGLRPDLASAAMNLARIDLSENKSPAARKRLTDVLEHNPKNAEALLALANLEFAEGHPDAGAHWLDIASSKNPELLGPKLLRIRYFLQRGDAQRAVGLARDTEAANPNNPELLALLAESQAYSGDRNGAVATYGRLAGLEPQSPRVQLEIARLEALDGHTAAASSALAKALVIDPALADAQIALAQLDLQMGKYDDARQIASKLQTAQPRSAAAFVISGDAWIAQKKYDRAIKSFTDAFALEKNGLIGSKLHMALAAAGRKKEADDLMTTWLAQHKEDRVSRLYLAATAQASGDRNRAEQLYQDVLQRNPNDVVALNELALIYLPRKDPRALELAERAYKLQPQNESVVDTLAWVLIENGNPGRGQQLLEKIVTSSHGNAEARYHLAVALARTGNKQRARSELTLALASANKFPETEDAKKLLSEL